MPANISSLKKLSVAERILLVEELWDSIANDKKMDELEFDAALKKELDQRLARHEAGKSKGYSWKQAKAIIRKSK